MFSVRSFEMIFQDAFSLKSVAGGFLGSSLMLAARYGIARGLFSNESGMGSAPIAAAAAQTRNPVRQALVSSTGTFWDTVVVCLMTGLVLVTSIMKNPAIDMGEITNGGVLTTLAFQQIPVLGPGDPCNWNYFFCVFYGSWMGILRRTLRRIFCRKKKA